MHQQAVGVAPAGELKRLAGADGYNANFNTGRLLKLGQDRVEQAGVLGGRG